MNPREFLDVAGDLAVGWREGDWRSAVSRAYYAVFHVARTLLRQAGFVVPQGEQAHGYLWLRLSNSGHTDVQQTGTDLKELRRARNWADYDLDRPLAQDAAIDFTHLGSATIQMLDSLPALPTVLAQVIDAIKIYERDVLKQVTWQP
jgi:uncharacterized protein (UPF0332 family)